MNRRTFLQRSGAVALRDAFVVERLRAAGVVLLGKTNLSEWANFRGSRSISGWSGRGGQTRNPCVVSCSPSGSSSGSACAVSAGFCTVAVGTETDGSIVSPASYCGVVGLKPTVGLISRSGIIPIAASQDTAGPMARTVADAAALLGAMTGADARDPATAAAAESHERRSPIHQVGVRSQLDLGKSVQFDVFYRYVDGLPSVNLNSTVGGTAVDVPAYMTFDARLAWKPSSSLELALVGQNLLDDMHPEFSSAPARRHSRSLARALPNSPGLPRRRLRVCPNRACLGDRRSRPRTPTAGRKYPSGVVLPSLRRSSARG